MAVTVVKAILEKFAENAQTSQYTVSDAKAIIDKFIARNDTSSPVTFAVNVIPSGGSAQNSNRVINISIGANKTYFCPELIGLVVSDGGSLSTLAGASNAIIIAATVREITTD